MEPISRELLLEDGLSLDCNNIDLDFQIDGKNISNKQKDRGVEIITHQSNIDNADPTPEAYMHTDALILDDGVVIQNMMTSDGMRPVIQVAQPQNTITQPDFMTESYCAPEHLEGMIYQGQFHLAQGSLNFNSLFYISSNPRFQVISNFYSYYRSDCIIKLTAKAPIGFAHKVKVTIRPPSEPGTAENTFSRPGFVWDISGLSTVYLYLPFMAQEHVVNTTQPFGGLLIASIGTPVSITGVPTPFFITVQGQLTNTKFYVLKHLIATGRDFEFQLKSDSDLPIEYTKDNQPPEELAPGSVATIRSPLDTLTINPETNSWEITLSSRNVDNTDIVFSSDAGQDQVLSPQQSKSIVVPKRSLALFCRSEKPTPKTFRLISDDDTNTIFYTKDNEGELELLPLTSVEIDTPAISLKLRCEGSKPEKIELISRNLMQPIEFTIDENQSGTLLPSAVVSIPTPMHSLSLFCDHNNTYVRNSTPFPLSIDELDINNQVIKSLQLEACEEEKIDPATSIIDFTSTDSYHLQSDVDLIIENEKGVSVLNAQSKMEVRGDIVVRIGLPRCKITTNDSIIGDSWFIYNLFTDSTKKTIYQDDIKLTAQEMIQGFYVDLALFQYITNAARTKFLFLGIRGEREFKQGSGYLFQYDNKTPTGDGQIVGNAELVYPRSDQCLFDRKYCCFRRCVSEPVMQVDGQLECGCWNWCQCACVENWDNLPRDEVPWTLQIENSPSSQPDAAEPELKPGLQVTTPVNPIGMQTNMQTLVGTNIVNVAASQEIYIPIMTLSLTEEWAGIETPITPARWFLNGTLRSQAQIEAERHYYCGPSKAMGSNSFCKYKITSTANAFQNGRLIVGQVPLNATQAKALTASQLTQYPHKEHELHGRETVVPCQWVRPTPVMIPRNNEENGILVIRLLETSFSTGNSAPQLTIWVEASNIEYSIPALPVSFVAPTETNSINSRLL